MFKSVHVSEPFHFDCARFNTCIGFFLNGILIVHVSPIIHSYTLGLSEDKYFVNKETKHNNYKNKVWNNNKLHSPYNYDYVTQYSNSKGVYGSRDDNVHNITKKEIQIIISSKNKGVRKENVIYMHSESNKFNCLEYAKPCVCGSLTHFKFTHVDCLLNPQYDDVIS